MKKIVLTGGGTAGHVTPNLALIPALREAGFEIIYIGSKDGIEKELIKPLGIEYYSVSAGKLRRYLSKKNISDVFKVISGVSEASKLIKKIKPDIVFSKGGFVGVPVVIGAKLNHVPIIVHESDITIGLANKLAIPFADAVLTTFPETQKSIKGEKGINSGTPIRRELFSGDRIRGLSLCGFSGQKPVVMMMGGSLGSVRINKDLRLALPDILKNFDLVHICGKGNADPKHNEDGYKQFEYVSAELKDIFAAADVVVSRAGSNSISEFLALKKPNLLIPLSLDASRGDQILNACSFEKQGFSMVLKEEDMTPETLFKSIRNLYLNRDKYIQNMENSPSSDAIGIIMSTIGKYIR
ncbi:MAG: undecaprenyldiphospho-muramoylpentapeptide beta-N-acetylglucosaminyltransferase [Lachnospiraceae bacterium]|nr:undecaprenyldiphospho-muramoylpentapeptide beta-N-acetylglucosaminyltransferase [Lachnospiraceae bacterium]